MDVYGNYHSAIKTCHNPLELDISFFNGGFNGNMVGKKDG